MTSSIFHISEGGTPEKRDAQIRRTHQWSLGRERHVNHELRENFRQSRFYFEGRRQAGRDFDSVGRNGEET